MNIEHLQPTVADRPSQPAAEPRLVATHALGRLAVHDAGDGAQPVIFWPSLFSDSGLYERVLPLLPGPVRAVCIDGPGFGRSEARDGDLQPQACARAVLEVMDALAIPRALFVGTSWGGQVGAHLAARAPDRIAGLVMANTPLAASLGGHLFERLGTRYLGRTGLWGRGVARSMFAEKTRREHPEVVARFIARFAGFEPRAAARTVAAVLSRSAGLAEVLPNIAVPTVVLMGASDALYPPARLRPLAERIPGARLCEIAGSGHLAPLESPEVVAAAIESLLPRVCG